MRLTHNRNVKLYSYKLYGRLLSQPKITPTWEFVSLTIYRGQLT